jgi:hypothetical protein
MADQPQQQPGFKLPTPGGPDTPTTTREAPPSGRTEVPSTVDSETGARDLAVAAGVLLVLVVAFVFARTAYANHLVGRKVAPRSANAAGWWLFIFLTSSAVIAVLGFVNQARFLALAFVVPLGLVVLVSLVLTLVSSRR